MKRLFYLLSMVALIAIGGGLTACTDPIEEIEPGDVVSVGYTLENTGISTAEIRVNSQGIDEIGYVATKGEVAPGGAVIFMTGEIIPVTQQDMTITVGGLTPDTKQWIHLATRYTDSKGNVVVGEVTSIEVTTYDYQELITILDTNEYGKITYHVNCPEGRTVIVSIQSRENYVTMKESFGSIDAGSLLSWYGVPQGEVITKPTTLTFDGAYWDRETNQWLQSYPMAPGETFVIIAGEVEKTGKMVDNGYGQKVEEYRVLYDFEGYADWFANYGEGGGIAPMNAPIHGDDSPAEEVVFWEEGALHQTVFTSVKKPMESALPLEFKQTTLTTQRAVFEVAPSDYTVVFYVCTDMREWDNMTHILGDDGVQSWITVNSAYFAGEDGAVLPAVDLQKDVTYRLALVAMEDAEGTRQRMFTYDFTVAEPTKPAPVMEVRAAQASEVGYDEHPNVAWFNVRSTTKDVVSLKYVCNSPNEFYKLFNSVEMKLDANGNPVYDENGQFVYYHPFETYTDVVNVHGTNYGITSDFIEQVNSEQGAYFSVGSFANAETTLAVIGYNDEDFGGDAAYANVRTIEHPAETPVQSDLFNTLLGSWTVKFTNIAGDNVEFRTDITDGTLPIGTMDELLALKNSRGQALYTPEEAALYFEQFQTARDTYKRSITNRNYVQCEGFNLTGYNWYWDMTYYSPWDLLIEPGSFYNAATVEDLFLDFGPKWYLKIGTGDKITMPVNNPWEMTANANGMTTFYQSAGYYNSAEDYNFNTDITEFNVELSADGNTMTIKGVKDEAGNTVYPLLYHYTYGGSQVAITTPSFPASDIVMTRGYDSASENARPKSVGQRNTTVAPAMGHNNRLQRTSFNKTKVVKPLEIFTWESVVAKYTK